MFRELCRWEDQDELGEIQWRQTWKGWVLVRSLLWTEQAGGGSSQSPTPYKRETETINEMMMNAFTQFIFTNEVNPKLNE